MRPYATWCTDAKVVPYDAVSIAFTHRSRQEPFLVPELLSTQIRNPG